MFHGNLHYGFALKHHREKVDVLSTQVSVRLDQLDLQTKQIVAALLNAQQSPSNIFSDEMKDQTRALTRLLSRFSNSTDDENRQPRSSLIDNGHFQQPNHSTNRDDVVPFVEMLDVSHKAEESFRLRVQNHILASLAFSTMTQRYEDVADAHQNTFDWAFHEKTTEELFWTNFSDWLVQGKGIYWVNGKAGSGKSTLLKFIYDDARARQYLQSWAVQTPLAMAAFFFWNSGTSEQKSQRGLLKSLLHDIWTQYPELIPVLLPSDWARTYSNLLNPGTDAPSMFWSLKTLMSIFKNLVTQTVVTFKLCLFVDGLDEYDGDHEELGNFFKSISSLPHVKVCLSSRPWIVFEDLFKGCPSLRLQDLTHRDIQCFVDDRLRSSDVYQALAITDSGSAAALVYEIVQKADGVFLWVKLVVRSLLNGLRNRDTIPDLRKRLSFFPKELGPLYDHIFSLIEPIYSEWASKAFQIMRAAQIQRRCRESVEAETPPLTLLALHFAINEEIEVEAIPAMNFDGLLLKCEDTKVQLTARCAGLLEVNQYSLERDRQYTLLGFPSRPIHWLHRTARDYIEHPSKWNELKALTFGTQFNPNTSLLKSCVLLLRHQRTETGILLSMKKYPWDIEGHAWFLSSSALIFAHHGDLQTHESQSRVLDQLSVLLSTPFKGGGDPYKQHSLNWQDYLQIVHREDTNEHICITRFLPLAVTYGLVNYVREKLLEQQQQQQSSSRLIADLVSTLTYIPLIASDNQGNYFPRPRFEMVELLLQLGADPDRRYLNTLSLWKKALQCLDKFNVIIPSESESQRRAKEEEKRGFLQILSLLIRYGAGNNACMRHDPLHPDVEELLQCVKYAGLSFDELNSINSELNNRCLRRHNHQRQDRRLLERRERINNNYSRRRRR